MKTRLTDRIRNYFKNNSRLKITGDIFFYLLILLLLIPVTRREIMTSVRKLTMMKPEIKEITAPVVLAESDYLFRFQNHEGSMLSLADFKGEVMFVNFWATWCPPCRAEMSSIQRLYNEYKYKAKFLLITTEETSTVMSYIEKNGYTFPVYFQRNTLPSSFRVTAIPQTYVIDRDENIIFSKTGAAKWDSNEFKEFFERIITH